MDFRSYSPADLEAMFQLDALCFSEPFQFDRATMQHFAEEPGAIVVLVKEGGEADGKEVEAGHPAAQLIAFIILHTQGPPADSYAYIVTIDVLPGRRRRGIGAAMLDRAETFARSTGATQISLHVAADNLAAIAFYERRDYQRFGLAKRFYREAGQDAIVFAKPL